MRQPMVHEPIYFDEPSFNAIVDGRQPFIFGEEDTSDDLTTFMVGDLVPIAEVMLGEDLDPTGFAATLVVKHVVRDESSMIPGTCALCVEVASLVFPEGLRHQIARKVAQA